MFEPEYAEVYGVPFAFIPSDRKIAPTPPSRPAVEVRALDERWPLRIDFPKVDGYRVEVPEERIHFDHEHATRLHVDRALVATWTQTEGVIGVADEQSLDRIRHARVQEAAYELAAEVVRRFFTGHDGALKPWVFPELLDVTRRWLAERVTFADDTPPGVLLLAQPRARAAEAVYEAVLTYEGSRPEILLPIYRPFDGAGSTDDVSFLTRKAVIEATKSHVNLVVLDGPKGNTWEEAVAGMLEDDERVAAFVKNDHLGFEIPYVYEGRSHAYLPDFLVRLVVEPGDVERTLVIEVSGGRKVHLSPGPTAVKATTARDQWCTAVNNDGGFGRWGYVEIASMLGAEGMLSEAIDNLYADAPIIGEPVR